MSFSKLTLELAGSRTTVAIGRPDNKYNCCRTGECEELRLRRSLPLVAVAMMSNRNSGMSLRITNSKRTLSFKLIGYWRLKRNATSSILWQHIGNRFTLKSIR